MSRLLPLVLLKLISPGDLAVSKAMRCAHPRRGLPIRCAAHPPLLLGVDTPNGLPPEETKRLPRYALLSVGRVAVDRRFQGRRLGGAPILDAAA